MCNASVILAVGLPIKWIGEQGEAFRKYLLRNKEVTFRCNDARFHVKIEGVEVYAQGFAAVAADLSSYQGFNIVADIGNGTMNVIFIIDGKPDSSRYYTECFGVEYCVIEMRSELTNKVHTVVDDCIVKKVLKDGTADIGEKYQQWRLKHRRQECHIKCRKIQENQIWYRKLLPTGKGVMQEKQTAIADIMICQPGTNAGHMEKQPAYNKDRKQPEQEK